MISSRFTRLVRIRHPVVLAGMGGVARAELAAAVSNAGGLGILGMIRMTPEFILDQIHKTRALTDCPFGVSLVPPVAHAPDGVESQFEVCLQERVDVIHLFWSDAAPFVDRCHAAGIVLMLQVGSAHEARRAAETGVDVIVAQGCEAGGHVRGEVGLLPLLPTVVDAVWPTPVLAAGGIVNGRGLAAALSLGAEGVCMGTRFVASEESEAHPEYKRRLLEACETDTVCIDRPLLEWPLRTPYRLLKTAFADARESTDARPPSSAAPTNRTPGQTDLMPNYAGQGVGLVRKILPAAAIVEEVVTDAEKAIQDLAALLA